MTYDNSRDFDAAKQSRLNSLHGGMATDMQWMRDAAASKQAKAVAQSKLYIAARLSGLSIEDANDHESVYQVESEDCPAYDDEKWNNMTLEQVAAKFGC